MSPRPCLALLVFLPVVSLAQTDTTRMKVVRSAPIEMTGPGNRVSSSASSRLDVSAAAITGDFTVSSAHPSCAKGMTTEDRAACSADAVRMAITTGLKVERPKGLDVVTVEFDVDEYGDVKGIRANTGTEPELGKALIVALHALPKFVPAMKSDARAPSHCSFAYRLDELFPGNVPTAAPAPADRPGSPAPAATAPERTTIRSGDNMITGAFNSTSAHPACALVKPGRKPGPSPEELVRCTADEVLKQIRSRLKAEAPAYMDVMVVDFDIDEYGDVKTIRANCASEPELGKAVIVALYGMPKFIPAKRDATKVASHCTFQYPVSALFAKP